MPEPGSPSEVELTAKVPQSFTAGDEEEGDLRPLNHDSEMADPFADGWGVYLHRSLKELLLGSYLNVLMLLTPFALLAKPLGWSDGVAFALSLLAIAPFAERLGFVTEQVALHTNDTLVRLPIWLFFVSPRSAVFCFAGRLAQCYIWECHRAYQYVTLFPLVENASYIIVLRA
jgi:hypothetical protein